MSLGEELQMARNARRLTASEVAAGTRMKVQIVEALEREDFDKIAAPIYAKGFIRLYAEFVGIDPKPLVDEYVSHYVSPPPEPIFDNELNYDEPEKDTHGRTSLFSRRKPEAEPAEPSESHIVSRPAAADKTGSGNGDAYDLFSGVNVRPGEDFHSDREPEPMLGGVARQFNAAQALRGFTALGRAIVDGVAGLPGQVRASVAGVEFSSPLRIASAAAILIIIFVFLASTLSRCAGPSESEDPPPALVVEENLNIAVEPPDTYLD